MRENSNYLHNKKLLILSNNALINGSGGAEHVCANMANVMNDAGMDVTVVTVENREGTLFYPLNAGVHFYNLYSNLTLWEKIQRELTPKKRRTHKRRIRLAKKLNEFITKLAPDVIICFSLPMLCDATLCRSFTAPIILTVHNNPGDDYTNRFPELYGVRSAELNKLYENTFNHAAVVQLLCDSYHDFMPAGFRGKTVTIGNVAPFTDKIIPHKSGNKKIVCIAQLDFRKNQSLLIRAFSLIAGKYPDWSVELWGRGCYEKILENLICELHLQGRVLLKGVTTDVEKVLATTDIFVLPSVLEGWPLVLGEAMSAGVPVIGLENCDGVQEIIRHGENGFLCKNDAVDMAEKISFLIENPQLCEEYGKQGREDMKSFAPDIIWGKWKSLISDVIKGNYE